VSNFLDMFQGEPVLEWMNKVAVACIGPVTAERAKAKGLKVTMVAKEYTIPSLTEAIVEYFSRSKA
jgi:uroporphyrinogen-III synthase